MRIYIFIHLESFIGAINSLNAIYVHQRQNHCLYSSVAELAVVNLTFS